MTPAGAADESPAARRSERRGAWGIAAAVVLVGAAAALHYHRLDLSLAHHDARAHLVVARRILDSLTPGWQQIGAVWLPVPHVLNMIPVQIDAWYRSGASAIAISVLSMGIAGWSLTRLVIRLTGSFTAAAAGALLLLGNPNVLYLQSTPMTEALLIAALLFATWATVDWIGKGAPDPPRVPRWAFVAACMTRYEAWPVVAALIVLSGVVLWRRGAAPTGVLRACARLAVYPVAAIVLFSANSRWTTGAWFVTSGFFVAENAALGDARLALAQVLDSLNAVSGTAWTLPAYAATLVLLWTSVRSRGGPAPLLVLSLAAAAALPWYAYYQGHPLRVRYAVPLVAWCAAATGVGLGLLWRPVRPLAAAAIVCLAFIQSPPLDRGAPLVVESQRDAENRRGRGIVTNYLREHWDGRPIMMSMGSLAHYMHDLAALHMRVRDFLHEGNEQLWAQAAERGPRGFVTWVIVEERAEGGDALATTARRNPGFLTGFDRVAEGGGVALYRARGGA